MSRASSLTSGVPPTEGCDLQITRRHALSPPTDSTVEFELGVGHSNLYPRLQPLGTARLAQIVYQSVDLLYEAPWRISNAAFPAPHNNADPDGTNSTATADASFAMPLSPLRQIGAVNPLPRIEPSQTNKYCDPLLSQLNISYWTKVDITNEYAASLISLFLEREHPFTGFFDADLFLQDLVRCRSRFCSAFLVNSILYYTSVGSLNW